MAGSAGIEIGLLGPLDVRRDGRPVPIPAPRLRAVLAVLAMSAGRFVSADTIAEAVWGDDLPRRPRHAVQVCVSRLRRLLGRDVIVAERGGGYRLDVSAEHVDALRLLRLSDPSRTPLEPAVVAEALALWRGAPFEGLESQWFAQVMRPSLTENYLSLLEQCAAAGAPGDLEARLSEMAERYPLRESLWARLVVLLERAGRHAEALRRCETIRARIADELGVDPGQELQRLESGLRSAVTGGRLPALGDISRQLPSDVDRFTGRSEVIAALDRLLSAGDKATAGDKTTAADKAPTGDKAVAPIGVLHGIGGVGKTALAVHWAHRVRDRFPDGQLFVPLRGYGPGPPMTVANALEIMLRGLNVPSERIPADSDGRSALLRAELTDRRTLVVLDNARDAAQIRPLLPGASCPSCMVVVTSRNQLRDLAATDGAHLVALDEFRPPESITLLASVLPEPVPRASYEEEVLAELARLCGHLPLALRIAAAHAVQFPGRGPHDIVRLIHEQGSRLDVLGVADDPASNLRRIFSWTYESLGPGTARMFRLLGKHPGPDVSLPAAAALSGMDTRQVRTLLDGLADVHLVGRNRSGRFQQHDLVRAYAAELAEVHDSDEDRRSALLRVLTFYIHSARNARATMGRTAPLAEIELPLGDVVPLTFADDRQALAWFDTMRDTAGAAVAAAAGLGLDEAAYALSQVMSLAFVYRRAHDDMRIMQEVALTSARRTQDRLAEATCARDLGATYDVLLDHSSAIELFQQAHALYEQAGSASGAAEVLASLGKTYRQVGRFTEAEKYLTQSVLIARRLGQRRQEARRLNNLAVIYIDMRRYEDAEAAGIQALDLCADTDRVLASYVWDTLCQAQSKLHKNAEAISSGQRALELCRELGDRWIEPVMLTNLARAQQTSGQFEDARRSAESALRIFDELELPDTPDLHRADITDLLAHLKPSR